MKNLKKVLLFAGFYAFVFIGCTNENEVRDEKYTDQSVEQIKANLEDGGLEVVEDLNALKSLDAIDVLQDFSALEVNDVSTAEKTIAYIASLDKSKGLPILRYSEEAYDLRNYSDFFDNNAGVYTYDKSSKAFTKTSDDSQIKFIFPSGGSSTNNSTLTISNFSTENAENSDFEDVDLLKSVKMTLVKNSETLLSVELSGSYNADDVPSSLTESIEFKEGYKISSTFTNTEALASMDCSFTKGTIEIASAHFETSGDYDYDNLKNNELDSPEDFNDFLKSANAWIKIKNYKVVGTLDYASLYKKLNTAGYGKEIDPETASECDKVAKIMNDNINMYVKYNDSNDIIAKFAFYTYEYSFSYYNYYELGNKLVFSDGSSVDDSFFDTGFDDLEDAIDDFMSDLENSYN